jgi:hypothetical protein
MSISFIDLPQLPWRTLKQNKDISNPIFHCQIKESATRPPTHPSRLRVHRAANSMAGGAPSNILLFSTLSIRRHRFNLLHRGERHHLQSAQITSLQFACEGQINKSGRARHGSRNLGRNVRGEHPNPATNHTKWLFYNCLRPRIKRLHRCRKLAVQAGLSDTFGRLLWELSRR